MGNPYVQSHSPDIRALLLVRLHPHPHSLDSAPSYASLLRCSYPPTLPSCGPLRATPCLDASLTRRTRLVLRWCFKSTPTHASSVVSTKLERMFRRSLSSLLYGRNGGKEVSDRQARDAYNALAGSLEEDDAGFTVLMNQLVRVRRRVPHLPASFVHLTDARILFFLSSPGRLRAQWLPALPSVQDRLLLPRMHPTRSRLLLGQNVPPTVQRLLLSRTIDPLLLPTRPLVPASAAPTLARRTVHSAVWPRSAVVEPDARPHPQSLAGLACVG